jgi:glycosyltransferase involved in cell wall biosynthesis
LRFDEKDREMNEWIKQKLRPTYNRLRSGEIMRLGPISLAWTPRLVQLRRRLGLLERELNIDGRVLRGTQEVHAPKQRRRRSVLFLHHAYYNFYHLARALRKRGWDAISVSLEGPDSPDAKYFHGEDVNLYDRDPDRRVAITEEFYDTVAARFRMLHFYGKGRMSFFATGNDHSEAYDVIPWDFIALRQLGVKIGYTVCGCLDGIAQTTFQRWSGGVCDKCVWQGNAQICSDRRNLAWGHKVQMYCDLIATEGDPALDYQGGAKCYREPLTSALDPEFWRPDLPIPDRWRLRRKSGELIVYHAVGNLAARARNGRNIKGTPAVVDAIRRLQADGINVRLEFVTDVPSREVRFLQAQADVIVDQLNFGRYGATAREGMMLGKPTICHINPSEPPGASELLSLRECPLISSGESSIYEVLKDLLQNPDKRLRLGQASRDYALKWHSADACAERFERVYDHLIAGESFVETI